MVAVLLVVPAFRQVDAVVVGERVASPIAFGDAIVVAAWKSCSAYDAHTLKRRWRRDFPDYIEAVTRVGDQIVATGSNGERRAARLYGLDARTGAIRWSVARKGPGAPAAADAKRLYTSLAPYTLCGLDRRTHRVLWSVRLSTAEPQGVFGGRSESLAVDSKTVIVGYDSTLYALDAASGRRLWSRSKLWLLDKTLPASAGVVWIGSAGLDIRTGKPRWQNPGLAQPESATVDRGRFLGIANGKFRTVDPETGRVRWSQTVGPSDTYNAYQYIARLGELVVAQGTTDTVALGPDGALRWTLPNDEAPARPVWSRGSDFVCFDGNRLLRYGPGAPDPLPKTPEARRLEADRLILRFGKLDDAGRKRLAALGPDAFRPTFGAFLAACAVYDRTKGSSRYDEYHDLAKLLDGMVRKDRTPEMLAALGRAAPDASSKPFLLAMLAKVGDPELVVPAFLKELRTPTPGFEMYESNTYVAREYIVRSPHPAAAAFMVAKLNDPKADPVLREEAYWHVAATGGEAGLRAVLAERRKRELLPPLDMRMDLAHPARGDRARGITTILAERTDPKRGLIYALAKCGVLGSGGDLWLLQKGEGGWNHPSSSASPWTA